jgi:hypothetical protein
MRSLAYNSPCQNNKKNAACSRLLIASTARLQVARQWVWRSRARRRQLGRWARRRRGSHRSLGMAARALGCDGCTSSGCVDVVCAWVSGVAGPQFFGGRAALADLKKKCNRVPGLLVARTVRLPSSAVVRLPSSAVVRLPTSAVVRPPSSAVVVRLPSSAVVRLPSSAAAQVLSPQQRRWSHKKKREKKRKSPWVESATPSVDYAFYDAYRADSWAGAGARAHRGLPAGGRELTAVT